ncbi:MAG TPA: exodeoxyribonuclease V subunit gamma, partial [Xanthomonadales bacterium]|nr:exodeoxyribonuclease V subunit gamma [Xanthomonadales bacterium]
DQRLPGLPRIAANLDMLLPSEWLDGLAHAVLQTEAIAIAPYRRPALRWRIYELLPTLAAREVARYLDDDAGARRRFQLADRLAGLYGQYLVYRRDWLDDWERQRAGKAPDHWQGALWRALVASVGRSHRGQRMGELIARLERLPPDPEQPALHVFGISHLPPDALSALERLATTREVCLYFPDPCRELWEDLRTRREIFQAQLEGGAYLTLGHPLLAALGRMGQHFALQLNALAADSDDRDHDDSSLDGPLAAGAPLLARVQHSVRTLEPDWARPDGPGDGRLDASLRVHSSHTRLRELEVLKDALLDQLAADPALHPRDIVVMAPNMALYAPLLPVVFGQRNRGPLPFHLADVALIGTHPLLAAFGELLDLPTQRIGRSQVLALLALPAVARRLQLTSGQHAALERWLDRSHVAWGLDGAMKTDFGAAAVDQHSFAFGIDRMLAGYLVGQEDADWLLGDILPAHPVAGPDAQCLGALWTLIELLREWRSACAAPRSLSRWSECLQGWIDRLFLADRMDAEEAEALNAVQKLVAGLARDAQAAGVDPAVDWAVVREVLRQGLDGIPERQPFLAGGVTFCGMVPQRAIPFAVVALLGLNDGDYPRPRADTGLDLMQQFPRLGDRDNRLDDRYLFLEALMSARRALHLSYVGEGVQDGKARNPALPLAELLRFLDDSHGLDKDSADRPWRVRHPLQPFDARYFEPANVDRTRIQPDAPVDPRLFSYSAEFQSVSTPAQAREWRFADPHAIAVETSDARVELSALIRYYRKPAEFLCRQALGLSRAALEDEAGSDSEPLTSERERFDRTALDLLWDALRSGASALPTEPPARLLRSGQLAAGIIGVRAWDELREEAQGFLDAARSLPPFAHGPARPAPVAIDLDLGGQRLVGTLGEVYADGDVLWLVAISNSTLIDYSKLLPLYAQWAALGASHPDRRCEVALLTPKRHDLSGFIQAPAALQQGLWTLLAGYRDAGAQADAYFPRTSHAFAQAWHKVLDKQPQALDRALEDAIKAASDAWTGGYNGRGERDYAPGYSGLLADAAHFLDPGDPGHGVFAARALRLYELINGGGA